MVCVLEDLHWAGTPTLQLLGHVTQHSAQSRLLLLCTHRTTAPDRSDELTYAIADLYRLDGVRRIDLPGLSADEVAQYLVAEGGLPARRAREYATVLRDQTGGNPFFLREMWRDIVARGGAAPARPSATPAPVSIRDTLQRRLSRLALREREVLETAAVLGDGGAVQILVAACGGDPGEALSALDTAARFGLVDAEELTRGRVAFPHGCSDYAHALLRGDFAAAERVAEDLLEVGRSFGPDDTEGPYGLQMYMVRRETGALEAVRPLVDVVRQAQATWEPGLLALYTELGLTGRPRACYTACWRARTFRRLGSPGGDSGPLCLSSSPRRRSRCGMPTPRDGCGPCWLPSPAGSLSPATSWRSSAPPTPTSPLWTPCSATTSQPSGCSSGRLTRTVRWGRWSTGPRSWPRGPAICVPAGTCCGDTSKCGTKPSGRCHGWSEHECGLNRESAR